MELVPGQDAFGSRRRFAGSPWRTGWDPQRHSNTRRDWVGRNHCNTRKTVQPGLEPRERPFLMRTGTSKPRAFATHCRIITSSGASVSTHGNGGDAVLRDARLMGRLKKLFTNGTFVFTHLGRYAANGCPDDQGTAAISTQNHPHKAGQRGIWMSKNNHWA